MSSPQNNEKNDHPPPNEEEYEEDIFRAIDAKRPRARPKNHLRTRHRLRLEEISNSKTTLMRACETHGNESIVEVLLSSGAPWNAVDDDGHCAGEYAAEKYPHLASQLMDYGVEVELLLGDEIRTSGASFKRTRRIFRKS